MDGRRKGDCVRLNPETKRRFKEQDQMRFADLVETHQIPFEQCGKGYRFLVGGLPYFKAKNFEIALAFVEGFARGDTP
jgi:hypothetical protein